MDFTGETDLTALIGREFLINGKTFAVADRYCPKESRGTGIVWAEPEWTATRGWPTGGPVHVGLKKVSTSNARSNQGATITLVEEGPVHGPFKVRIAFREPRESSLNRTSR